MSRARFPRHVYGVGTDPDPRFSLANERTLLAWLRTGLALMAAGVALQAVDLTVAGPADVVASAILLGLGVVCSATSWVGWARAERALRLGEPLPAPVTGLIVAGGTIVAAVVLAIGLALG